MAYFDSSFDNTQQTFIKLARSKMTIKNKKSKRIWIICKMGLHYFV